MADLKVNVGVNNTAFNRGLDSMRTKASAWASDMSKNMAGLFALGAMVNWFNNFRTGLDSVAKLATRVGESTATIQRVADVASKAGTSIEVVSKEMTRMAVEASRGSEKFAALGLSAQEFANLNLEGRIMLLSRAYQQATTDQSKMLAMLDLLGEGAQEIIPLLAQGPQALAEGFSKAAVVSEQSIRAIEALNDAMTTGANEFKVFVGWMIQSVATIGLVVKTTANDIANVFQLMNPANMTNPAAALDAFSKNARKNSEERQKAFKDIWSEPEKAANKPSPKPAEIITPEQAKAAADEKKKVAAEADKLEAALTARKLEQMTVEERILELQRMEAELRDTAANESLPELQRLEAANELLTIQGQIEAAQKEQADNAKRVAEAQQALDERKKQRELESLSVAERIARLEAMKSEAELAGQSAELTDEQRIEKANEVLDLEDAIAAAKKEQADEEEKAKQEAEQAAKDAKDKSKPGMVASALGEIGGGGGSYISGDPATRELQTQTNLLKQLVANTSPQQQRAANTKPEEAF